MRSWESFESWEVALLGWAVMMLLAIWANHSRYKRKGMALTKQTRRFIEELPEPPELLTLGRQDGEKIKAGHIRSLDIDPSDGADIVWDMNLPVPKSLHGTFDMVLDGGTLEHVWNIQQALENCFAMLRPEGWFVSHQLCNFAGHGFWSLCPEGLWKWSLWKGMWGQRCWVYSPLTRILRNVTLSTAVNERIEFTTTTHFYMLFRAQRQTGPVPFRVSPAFQPQAGPARPTNLLRRWLWETRLWRWPRVTMSLPSN